MSEWVAATKHLKKHGLVTAESCEHEGFIVHCKKWHFGLWHCSAPHKHSFLLQSKSDRVYDCYEENGPSMVEVKRRAAKPCQKTVFALLCAQRRTRFVPKDVALIIARIVWETRYDYDVWPAEEGRKEKRKKDKKDDGV